MNLAGKTAIVTGAGSGIGRAVAIGKSHRIDEPGETSRSRVIKAPPKAAIGAGACDSRILNRQQVRDSVTSSMLASKVC